MAPFLSPIQSTQHTSTGLTYGEKPLPSDNPSEDAFFFDDYPAGPRCLHWTE
jgi:hypothetical protein